MCGCEHHRDHNAPCTCTCPDHKAVRAEMSRTAPMSATDHTLTDAERAMFERIEDTGDTQGLTWRVQELVTEARALADEESAARVALANQLIAAEAKKEALRAERERYKRDATVMLGYTQTAEAALAGLVAGLSELADDLAARAEHCHNLADDETSREEKKRLNGKGTGLGIAHMLAAELIDADHAAALRAREAKALREAADDLLQVGLPSPSRREVHVWLRDRADSIEQARP